MRKTVSIILTALIVAMAIPITSAQDDSNATLPKVQNVSVSSVGDAEVTLTWDPVAEATGYIVQYGTESILGDAEVYNRPPIEVGNVTQYTVSDLENGREYFFAVIAQDDSDNVSNIYSDEVSATPQSASQDGEPSIIGVDAIDDTTVRIVFSEEMNLPQNPATNLTIIKNFDSSTLGVELVNQDDPVTLSVKTAVQDEGAEYIITLSEFFTDTDGNPLPENARSEVFIGGSASTGETDQSGEFKVDQIINVDQSAIEVVFSKDIVLGDNPEAEFAIVETSNPENELQVLEVRPSEVEQNKVLIITDTQQNISYTLLLGGVADLSGNELSDANKTITFNGFQGTKSADTIPPEEVSNLTATVLDMEAKSLKLNWSASANTAGDLKEYLVYLKVDDGEFSLLGAADVATNDFEVTNLPEGAEYTFKVSAVDLAGNETNGLTVVFDPGLFITETGPGHLIAILAAAFVASAAIRKRRPLELNT